LTIPQHHSSRIELSRSSLQRNVSFIQSLIGRRCRLSFVIKANAYGHGTETIVPMAEQAGIDHFSVFSSDEAVKALNASSGCSEIMIMGYIPDEAIPWAMEKGVSYYITCMERLEKTAEFAGKHKLNANIHLELETGFHRTGLLEEELPRAAAIIRESRGRIVVKGTATHYAGAESIANYYRIQRQISRFDGLCLRLGELGVNPRTRHSACSAAALTYPETRMDMVRCGIALYGFWPSQETKMNYLLNYPAEGDPHKAPSPLSRVMSWKTRIMSVHRVPPGCFIGYGNSCQTTVESRFAAIPIGYSHGFSRDLSNCGYVLVRGKRANVSGVVNMNMLLADITEIPGAERGDEVVIIGTQEGAEITVSSFSALSQYLNYEVLVQIPADIPRMAVD
jgi:alanine racemase